MNSRIMNQIILATSLLIGTSFADIPGLFVVQQAGVSDPLLQTLNNPTTSVSEFGGSDIQSIGDVDQDGIEDIITGSRRSFHDSGSLVLVTLNQDGTPKDVVNYSTRAPAFNGLLDSYYKWEKFGDGVAVLTKFSSSQNCAQLMVSSAVIKRFYGINICREVGSNPKLTVSSVIDSTSNALNGISFWTAQIKATMTVIDTIAFTGESVVAMGVNTAAWLTQAGKKSNSGAVILFAVKPGSTWSWRRLSTLPSSLDDPADPLFGEVYTGSYFGYSITSLRGKNGEKALAVLASGDTVNGIRTGRIHILSLNSSYGTASRFSIPGTSNLSATDIPLSLSSSDFNHDGITDLIVGYSKARSTLGEELLGGYSINILDASFHISASKLFTYTSNGIVNSTAIKSHSRIGSKILALDFDHDGQLDVLAGAPGEDSSSLTPRVPGHLWAFRMKSIPWLRQPASVIGLSQQQWVPTRISDYLTGNQLKCDFTPPDALLAECTFGNDSLICRDKNHNGTATARIICRDTGNIPVTDHFIDTLDFILKITLVDSLPQRKQNFAPIGLREDQTDTSVLAFSNYFRDPENGPLSYAVTKIGSTSFTYLDTAYVTNGSLHIKALPLKFGACSLSVKVTDTAGGYRFDTLKIQIAHKNHAPIAKDDAITTTESTPISIPVMANDLDPDKDPLTISVASRSAHGSTTVLASNKNEILFKPDSFYLGKDSIQYVLKDDSTSVTAWVRINIIKTALPPRVVRPLPTDVTILESSDTLRVSFDSLFFSGTEGFNVPVFPIDQGCDYIAKTILDRVTRTILIVPIPYKSGECRIRIWQSATKDSIGSAMMLHITPVPNPYQFWTDTLYIQAIKNSKTVYQLKDSIDKDDDTLEYSFLENLAPSWIQIDQASLVMNPDKASTDIAFTIATRKKAKPGAQPNPATDSMVVIVEASNTSIHGRKFGSLKMKYQSSTHLLMFQGGGQSFAIDVLQPNGRSVGSIRGSASEVVSLHVPSSLGMLYLRILDGNRRSTFPILLYP